MTTNPHPQECYHIGDTVSDNLAAFGHFESSGKGVYTRKGDLLCECLTTTGAERLARRLNQTVTEVKEPVWVCPSDNWAIGRAASIRLGVGDAIDARSKARQ
jgi:hypothetical protein